jgi:hypothetical protein
MGICPLSDSPGTWGSKPLGYVRERVFYIFQGIIGVPNGILKVGVFG